MKKNPLSEAEVEEKKKMLEQEVERMQRLIEKEKESNEIVRRYLGWVGLFFFVMSLVFVTIGVFLSFGIIGLCIWLGIASLLLCIICLSAR
jgi:uncharacterized membrane protein